MQATDVAKNKWVNVGRVAREQWKTYAELKEHKGEIVYITKDSRNDNLRAAVNREIPVATHPAYLAVMRARKAAQVYISKVWIKVLKHSFKAGYEAVNAVV